MIGGSQIALRERPRNIQVIRYLKSYNLENSAQDLGIGVRKTKTHRRDPLPRHWKFLQSFA